VFVAYVISSKSQADSKNDNEIAGSHVRTISIISVISVFSKDVTANQAKLCISDRSVADISLSAS